MRLTSGTTLELPLTLKPYGCRLSLSLSDLYLAYRTNGYMAWMIILGLRVMTRRGYFDKIMILDAPISCMSLSVSTTAPLYTRH